MNSQNKFYQEGYNSATSTIQDPYSLPSMVTENPQVPVSFDFTPPMISKENREQYIAGYEAHIRQAYASYGNQLYFFPN